MSRRTKKQEQQLEAFLQSILLLIAGASYFYTKSWIATGLIVGIAFFIILFITIFQANKRKRRLRESGIAEIDSMDGILFEHFLKELYSSKGYNAEVTRAGGDFGGDVLLSKNGKKIVVQAKRHTKNIGIKAVQEVIGAKSYYAANEAWVVTNSYFTKAAIGLAEKSCVSLVDREQLIDMLLVKSERSKTNGLSEIPKSVSIIPEIICIKCGSPMVLRNGKRGQFLGCSNFPKCRHTQNVG